MNNEHIERKEQVFLSCKLEQASHGFFCLTRQKKHKKKEEQFVSGVFFLFFT